MSNAAKWLAGVILALAFFIGLAFLVPVIHATWTMLRGPDGNIHPVYMEPEIIVSPFPLHQQKGEV